MVNADSLNIALIELADKRIELSGLNYSDESYDDLEEELHDMEDAFVEKYGKYLEKVFEEVHEKYCSDTEVLLPIAYIAKNYTKNGQLPNGKPAYDVSPKEGVWVELDENPDLEAHLVLVPNPARILLMMGDNKQKEVWRAEK
ncbi:MAG: hypothetical protein V4714_17950 [Bacteroidota bacterium]